ncbi:MAG: DNA repair exonuclease [Candidatus Thermoplasmatota archaeon]
MRFIHVADTHLGYAAYSRLSPEGYNQRELDVHEAFRKVVDLAIERRVDAVLHAGDLFDSVRPSNRTIAFAFEEVSRLSEADINFVAISGNHSTPRLRATGSVFRLFESIRGAHPVYKGGYEQVEIGDAVVHCVPHCLDQAQFEAELSKVSHAEGKRNVALMHCAVKGVEVFSYGELNELSIGSGQLWRWMDYIALGHYHEPVEVRKGCRYAGSTERFSFSEAGHRRGIVEVDLERGDEIFLEIGIREMCDLPEIDCRSLAPKEILERAAAAIQSADPEGKILRLTLSNIPRSVQGAIDFRALKAVASDALHLQMRIKLAEEGYERTGAAAQFRDLCSEFDTYLHERPIEGLDRKRLAEMGTHYLRGGGGLED